jgi:hypothetical protein
MMTIADVIENLLIGVGAGIIIGWIGGVMRYRKRR